MKDTNSWIDSLGLTCKKNHANKTSGNNPAAQRGKQAHKDFQKKINAKKGWQSEPTLLGADGKIYKPDAVTPSGTFIELKPNTPRGRSRGRAQAKKYREQLGMNGKVVYYDP
ncbi:MAG: hypothetical protein LBJ98_00565 [Endomicrobium sp.]|nr:hypothetical protein [Endomicrobium sp.]